ncbi:DUF4402 domain-containing protein [Novosphingobium sp.]|uniref:DUF4402 domain-containing protein n=1 Tax=Novosphingobium sp. TaxID=1874826 RepID=UPI0033413F78
MKHRILSAVAIGLALGAIPAGNAFAASGNTSTAAGTVTAAVVAPIVLTHVTGAALSFGKFTVSTGGTVVVTAASAGSTTGSVNFVPGGTVVTADRFTVAGDNSRSFSITTTNSTISNGARTMAFTTTPSAATLTTSATGTAAFTVGGTLTAVGTETPGNYTGTYNATVTYN